jgi:RNA polymerase sigma-70 factor (ECF subfamily)
MDQVDADYRSLQKIQRGEEAGLRELMERHREALFRFIFRFVRNEADAAELTEATFLRVYRHAGRFQPRAKVVTWIFSIAGNLCRDFLRKSKKRAGDLSLNAPVGGGDGRAVEASFSSGIGNPEDNAVSREELAAIETAIHKLPHKLKFPFITCVLEEHSYDACAEMLGTTRKAVETRIYRARKRLQQELADLVGEF